MASGKGAVAGRDSCNVPCVQSSSTWLGSAPHLWAELFPRMEELPGLFVVWMLGTESGWCVLLSRAFEFTKARTAKPQSWPPLSCC